MRIRFDWASFAALSALAAGCSAGSDVPAPAGITAVRQASDLRAPFSAGSTALSVLSVAPRLLYGGSGHAAFVNAPAVAAAATMIAVSDPSEVNIYNTAGTQIARLTGFYDPQGLASDRNGDLFVADTSNSRVQMYAGGFKGAPVTLSDPVGYPADVDSFANGAIVAVTNIYDAPCCQPGSVSFYTAGKMTATIADPALAKPYFCAFDASGNLYVDGEDANGAFVIGEIVGGANGKKFNPLTTANKILSPGGVQVKLNGQLAILDQNGATVYTYDPPQGQSLGKPVMTTKLTQAVDPVTFAFTRALGNLYTADAGIFASQRFAYPLGGNALSTINVGAQAVGVVVLPAQIPYH